MAAATMYVTPAGAGTKAGNDWANAMGLAEFETDFEGAAEAGDIYYLAGGTYTLTNNLLSTRNGSQTSPISVIGVTVGTSNEPPIASDWATGDGRPLIASGTYIFGGNDYTGLYNLRTTGTAAYLFRLDSYSLFVNCKATNTNSGDGIYCGGAYSRVIGCECSSTTGTAFDLSGSSSTLLQGCYAHDSATGVTIAPYSTLVMCIAETCTTGISLASNNGNFIVNCTIDNCTTGVSATTSYAGAFLNNIISNNTSGASWTTEQKTNHWDYNNWYGNTGDVSNVTKGNNALAVDPQFTNAAGGDFSIGTNLKAAGFPGAFPGGLSTGYLDVGAVQRQEAAGAAGGLLVHPGMAGGMRG